MKESLDEAAYRELQEETGVKDVYLEQLYTYGDVDRQLVEEEGLAFDHGLILQQGIERLRNKLEYTDVIFPMMAVIVLLDYIGLIRIGTRNKEKKLIATQSIHHYDRK